MVMAKDKYMFNPLFLGPELSLVSSTNTTASVPVSQYKPYLEAMFGSDIPAASADRSAAEAFFDATTAYSIDDSMRDILLDKQTTARQKVGQFIPRWLQLAEPVVDSAAPLYKAVSRHLKPYEQGELPTAYDHDMYFLAGIFYSSTQLASVAMDIPHPSQLHPDLVRPVLKKGHSLIGGNSNEPLPQTMLLIPGIVKAENIRKANLLKAKTVALNERAQRTAERVISITAAVHGKRELEQLFGDSAT